MVREVIVSTEQYKSIPGHSTRLSLSRLKGMVNALLTENGVQDMAWITKGGEDTLIFQMEVEIHGVAKTISFQFQPPMIVWRKKKGGRWVNEPRPEASWRVFHDLLERTLASAKLGIMPVHHVLMAYIASEITDDTGRKASFTMGEVIDAAISEDKLERLGAALEDRRERKAVDSEVTI